MRGTLIFTAAASFTLLLTVAAGEVFAQAAPIVQWTAALKPSDPAGQGESSVLELSATILEGWHVYAAKQQPGGPTPLRVSLDKGSGAQLSGTASGTVPQKRHDASFDLDTELYTQAFTILTPVVWRSSHSASAALPVAVTFQSCNERECRPPQTVHLLVSSSGTVQP